MIEELKRTSLALAGGMAGAVIVGLVEARGVLAATAGAHSPTLLELFTADIAVLAPLGAVVSLAVAAAHFFLEPNGPRPITAHAAAVRAEPVLARSRMAAMWPLSVLVAAVWTIASAHIARAELARGSAVASGLKLAVSSMALLFALTACALALLPFVRRLLAAGAERAPRLLDPVTTGGAALLLGLALIVAGIAGGDTGGDGAWPLGIFGVLKRRELDVRAVVNLIVVAIGAYMAPIALYRRQSGGLRAAVAAALTVLPLVATAAEAKGLDRRPHVARAIERYAPLGKIALAAARAATDRDHDGASPLFAGGDCDDRNPRVYPSAVDVPGNGIDEDCSGADLAPPPAPPPPAPPPQPSARIPDDLNIILLTIDTLRTDTGFMGYAKDTTPNLDKLAQKSIVFDRAYAMASYTGKSLAPMLIGKYPNETDRDGGHFNTYAASNVFVAERLKSAGIFTMGAASHWYFSLWSGLSQGIDTWDLTAKPSEGQGDNDTSVTSFELATAAIRVLSKANTQKRFFFWVHFFDPHAQYMPHPGAPNFVGNEKGPTAMAKAAYDAEVWFTDKHVGRLLDHVAAQPWGAKTAIIVSADHGEAFSEHGMSFHGVELWESLVRVPLVVYVPGLEPHHVPVKRGHIDVVPTILDLMKIAPPEPGELRGTSLVPDLLAREGDAYVERDVYLDMPAGPYNLVRRGLITGKTPGVKLIHFGGTQVQLFDLAADPGEKDDLGQDKERVAPVLEAYQSLRAGLQEIDVKPDTPPPP